MRNSSKTTPTESAVVLSREQILDRLYSQNISDAEKEQLKLQLLQIETVPQQTGNCGFDKSIKKQCPKCKTVLSQKFVFCPDCGTTLADYAPPVKPIPKPTASTRPTTSIDSDQVRCPKCGSTQITAVQRKWSFMAGFATNKVDRFCLNCKHKW